MKLFLTFILTFSLLLASESKAQEVGEMLYVVDGVIMDKNAYDSIPKSDLKTFEFLSPKQATSAYGQRARYGAIISTRKDKNSQNQKYLQQLLNQEEDVSNQTFEVVIFRTLTSKGKPVHSTHITDALGKDLCVTNKCGECFCYGLNDGDTVYAIHSKYKKSDIYISKSTNIVILDK